MFYLWGIWWKMLNLWSYGCFIFQRRDAQRLQGLGRSTLIGFRWDLAWLFLICCQFLYTRNYRPVVQWSAVVLLFGFRMIVLHGYFWNLYFLDTWSWAWLLLVATLYLLYQIWFKMMSVLHAWSWFFEFYSG